MIRPRSLATLALAASIAGCAAAERRPAGEAAAPPPAERERQERPTFLEIEPPESFRRAIERDTRTTRGVPGADYWQQWADYALDARLDTDARRLDGTATIVYHNRSPDTLRVLNVNLLQNLHAPGAVRIRPAEVTGGVELKRVSVAGRPLEEDQRGPGYRVRGTLMTIRPPAPVLPGERVTLEIDYGFDVPQRGAGGRMGYSEENLVFLAYWYPIMAVYDDVIGWHTDQFLSNAEFYAGFGSYDITLEAPAEWMIVSTGTLTNPNRTLSDSVRARLEAASRSDEVLPIVTSENFGELATMGEAGETLTWRFRADSVHDVAISATKESNWDAARSPVGDIDRDGLTDYALVNALYREAAERWEHVARYEQHAIAFFSDFTGVPYPWPHMTAVEGGGIIGGGMEFPMMTLMGDYTARGDSALYYVTAHELAHMWIPMIVSNDERRYAWMDEGLTTFAENVARTDFFPGRDHHEPDRQDYLEIAGDETEGEIVRWSDYHYPGAAYRVASYDKPATVMVALREVLGEETFMEAYRAFFDRWAFRHAYPWDLFNTFEDVSGRDLDWFWRSWFYETWTLDQAVVDVTVEGDTTRFVIEDRGRAVMPVPLAVECAGGETVRRTIPVDPWLEGRTRTSTTVDCRASRIEIDPGHAFPDVDRTNNVWTAGGP
ncbi:MAG: M1 family metallopeptidase [Gemmatimonadota bacterium]|nr:M1 family metallopeptidase [Gemmatimonadota bacterium]